MTESILPSTTRRADHVVASVLRSLTLRARLAACLAATLGCLLSIATLAHADWPLFRGNPLQTGIAEGTLPEKLEIVWKLKADEGVESTAAIVDKVAYIGSFDGHLYAIDLADGKIRWKYKTDPKNPSGIKAPPSVRAGKVYVGDEGGLFHCVDIKTGNKIWTFETNGEITGGANFAGDDILIGSHDSTLYCLSPDGKERWKFKTEGPVNGSAVVAGNSTFVAGCDSNLHVIDLKSGKASQTIDLGGQAGATAAVVGNNVYVGTMTNQLVGIDLAMKPPIVWQFEPKKSQPFYASAAVTDNLVIVGCRDRSVHAVDRKTGELTWSFPTKNRVDSSPVVAGKRVYFGSSDGRLYVVDTAKGNLIQSMELGRGIVSAPAVSDNMLVIGTTDGWVYGLGKKE